MSDYVDEASLIKQVWASMEKQCVRCGETKALSQFRKDGDRYRSICRICRNDYDRLWRAGNPERTARYRANRQLRFQNDPELRAESYKQHAEWQRNKIVEDPDWHERHKAEMRRLNKLRRLDPVYNANHRERQREYQRRKRLLAKEQETSEMAVRCRELIKLR